MNTGDSTDTFFKAYDLLSGTMGLYCLKPQLALPKFDSTPKNGPSFGLKSKFANEILLHARAIRGQPNCSPQF